MRSAKTDRLQSDLSLLAARLIVGFVVRWLSFFLLTSSVAVLLCSASVVSYKALALLLFVPHLLFLVTREAALRYCSISWVIFYHVQNKFRKYNSNSADQLLDFGVSMC